jgi:hypothetical protein
MQPVNRLLRWLPPFPDPQAVPKIDPTFQGGVRTAQTRFMRDFQVQESRANRWRFACMDAALHLQGLFPPEGVVFWGVPDLEVAIASLLCSGLEMPLPDFCTIHPAFQRRMRRWEDLGIPDRMAGLTAIHRFAEKAQAFVSPDAGRSGEAADPLNRAILVYRQARWYPDLPHGAPPFPHGKLSEVKIRGVEREPCELVFIATPSGNALEFERRPHPDASTEEWLLWWHRQLLNLPPNAVIWRGHDHWVRLDDHIASLRKGNQ